MTLGGSERKKLGIMSNWETGRMSFKLGGLAKIGRVDRSESGQPRKGDSVKFQSGNFKKTPKSGKRCQGMWPWIRREVYLKVWWRGFSCHTLCQCPILGSSLTDRLWWLFSSLELCEHCIPSAISGNWLYYCHVYTVLIVKIHISSSVLSTKRE